METETKFPFLLFSEYQLSVTYLCFKEQYSYHPGAAHLWVLTPTDRNDVHGCLLLKFT